MEKVIDIKEIDMTTLKKIGSGTTCDVYRLGNYALKIVHLEGMGYYPALDQIIDQQMDCQSTSYSFPLIKVKDNQQTMGAIYDYVSGKRGNILSSLPTKEVITALIDFENSTIAIGKEGFLITDVSSKNLIYSKKKGIIAIDTLDYLKENSDMSSENLKRINKTLLRMILGDDSFSVLMRLAEKEVVKQLAVGPNQVKLSQMLQNNSPLFEEKDLATFKRKIKEHHFI